MVVGVRRAGRAPRHDLLTRGPSGRFSTCWRRSFFTTSRWPSNVSLSRDARAGSPCDRSPATARARAGSTARPRSSWCGPRGRAVGVGGAGPLQVPEVLVLGDVLGALEHHVLEQVRETGAPRLLVLRADLVPDVDDDLGHAVVLVEDHLEAVRQSYFSNASSAGGPPGAGRSSSGRRCRRRGRQAPSGLARRSTRRGEAGRARRGGGMSKPPAPAQQARSHGKHPRPTRAVRDVSRGGNYLGQSSSQTMSSS